MSIVTVQGNAGGTGTLTVTSPNTNSNYTVTLPTATTTLVGTDATQTLTNKTLTSPTLTSPTISGTPVMGASVITSGTAQASTSGTSINFTGIPSWVKRITVMFSGVSTNGTSIPQIQLGDAGGVEITGYAGYSYNPSTATTSSTGATLAGQWSAASALYGSCTISLIGSKVWAISFAGAATGLNTICACGYGKTLSDTLDRVRITTVNGTDTFDAGSINILYE